MVEGELQNGTTPRGIGIACMHLSQHIILDILHLTELYLSCTRNSQLIINGLLLTNQYRCQISSSQQKFITYLKVTEM